MPLSHFARIEPDILCVRTPDLHLADLARLDEGIQIGARHAARADHTDNLAVRTREVFYAETGATANPVVLQEAVVDHRHRRAILGAEQKQESQERPRLLRVLVLAD